MTTLSNSEKLQVINSRIKSLNYNKYNLDIDLIVENAKASPVAATISALNTSISEVNTQIAALTTEAAKYTPEEE
jgi:ABC-type phosphate transport system auxiliary subunit